MRLVLWQALVLTALWGVFGWRRLAGMLYLFQLDEYLPKRLAGTLRRRLAAERLPSLLLLLGAALMALACALLPDRFAALPLLVALLLLLPTSRPFARAGQLRWTARSRRIAALAGALLLASLFFALWYGWTGAVLVGLAEPLMGLGLSLGALLLWPYERWGRSRYMRSARRRLQQSGAVVVGITGSYGKTTTKALLQQLLDSAETPCFATPQSFNTTLGVCRAINEGLQPGHRYAVIEMGAYRPGEIREICSFTAPRYGIVTAIGPMHLERFGTRQRVALAKSELLAALPEEGMAVLPRGIAELKTLTAPLRAPTLWVGTEGDRWWAEGLRATPSGTSMTMRGSQGEAVPLTVPLHGRHLVADLVLAWALAVELGVPPEQLVKRCSRIQGVAHRLQVSEARGITIIDDAYNSNPEGAAEALRLLAELPGQRRVLVTPGFIELGAEEAESMRQFGRQAALVCTHVILVGPRHTEPLRRGLEEGGLDASAITVVTDLSQAQSLLPSVAGSGSVVLFENDLPDQYRETA